MALAILMLAAELAAGVTYIWSSQDRSIDAAYAALHK